MSSPKGHGPRLAARILVLDEPIQVFILEACQEGPDPPLDFCPRFDERCRSWIVVGLERRPPRVPAAPVEPTPFGAESMDHRVPDRTVTASHVLRELLRRQLRNDREKFLVGPVTVVVQPFKIFNGHVLLLGEFVRVVRPTLAFQPRPLIVARAAGGCKRQLGRWTTRGCAYQSWAA